MQINIMSADACFLPKSFKVFKKATRYINGNKNIMRYNDKIGKDTLIHLLNIKYILFKMVYYRLLILSLQHLIHILMSHKNMIT